MNKIFIGLVALLLVPCLITDPASALAFAGIAQVTVCPPVRNIPLEPFDSEAISVPLLSALRSMLTTGHGWSSWLRSAGYFVRSRARVWVNPAPKKALEKEDAELKGLAYPQLVQEARALQRRIEQLSAPERSAFIYPTPFDFLSGLTRDLSRALHRTDIEAYTKREDLQNQGAYKERGVGNHVFHKAIEIVRSGQSLSEYTWVTESTGNHARALMEAVLVQLPMYLPRLLPEYTFDLSSPHPFGKLQVYVPYNIPDEKMRALSEKGGEGSVVIGEMTSTGNFQFFGEYGDAAAAVKRKIAQDPEKTLYVGHDSPWVIAGHGTVLLDILDDLKTVHPDWFDGEGRLLNEIAIDVPAGSFGMVAGVALAAQTIPGGEKIKVIAAQSRRIRGGVLTLMLSLIGLQRLIPNASLDGEVVVEDGTAVDEPGPQAIETFRRIGHAAVVVDVKNVVEGVRTLYRDRLTNARAKGEKVKPFEGSVGIAVGALKQHPWLVRKAKAVFIVLSGGNTDEKQWAKVWTEAEPTWRWSWGTKIFALATLALLAALNLRVFDHPISSGLSSAYLWTAGIALVLSGINWFIIGPFLAIQAGRRLWNRLDHRAGGKMSALVIVTGMVLFSLIVALQQIRLFALFWEVLRDSPVTHFEVASYLLPIALYQWVLNVVLLFLRSQSSAAIPVTGTGKRLYPLSHSA